MSFIIRDNDQIIFLLNMKEKIKERERDSSVIVNNGQERKVG
jgi:hypothetical protein